MISSAARNSHRQIARQRKLVFGRTVQRETDERDERQPGSQRRPTGDPRPEDPATAQRV